MLGDQFGARTPQQLRASLPVTGAGGPGGSYSLEAMWTIRTPPCCCSQIHCHTGNELDKVVTESNASPGIKGEGVGVTIKVTGDNLVLSTAQDALEGALWCLLHYLLDVII